MSVRGQNEIGSAQTFWKITKHDVHSIPEGRWVQGQVEVRSQDGINYWVRRSILIRHLFSSFKAQHKTFIV